MAPGAKRKRGESNYANDSHDGSNRPSPHRPGNLGMAQRSQDYQQQGRSNSQNQRGGRRPSRGGRGNAAASPVEGSGSFASPKDGGRRPSNSGLQNSQTSQSSPSTKTVMSPPPPPPGSQPDHTQSKPMATADSPAPAEIPTTEASRPPPFYFYEHLTEDRLRDWEASGKKELVKVASESLHADDFLTLSLVFQELIRAGLDKKLDTTVAGGVVQEILQESSPDDPIDGASAFLDTLSILTDSDIKHPRIKPLLQATGIPPQTMRKLLEESLLVELGLVRKTFNKVFVRKQTNLLYRQSNYNLLREESEGYSKLLNELFTRSNTAPTAETVADVYENIKALIGAFDLDAGRVLDVTLDVFASVLVKFPRFFAKFLRMSSFWPQDQNLGTLHIESQGFSGLPWWAEPDHSHWDLNDEEVANFVRLKQERDRKFWDRAREIGMDAYFELCSRKVIGDQELPDLLAENQSEDVRAEETRKWITATRTLPPVGNDVAAQLLGFKLRFYASQARDATDVLPASLIYLAALLIKIGFISLRDLYTHLYPADEAMDSVKEKQMKAKEEREKAKRPGGNAPNALERAGALKDDTVPPAAGVSRLLDEQTRSGTPSRSDPTSSKAGTPAAKSEEEDKDGEKEELPEPSDQKIQLLRSLFLIGALPEALYMLGRFQWLPDAFPELPDHIHRILHRSLAKVYEDLRPLKDRSSCKDALQSADKDQSGLGKGDIRFKDAEKIKSLRWALLEKRDYSEGNDYRFYWDDWDDNIPVCQTVDDVFTLCSTFLNLTGVKIGQDPSLLLKIVRIGKYSLAQDSSELNKNRWYDLCKRLLCPALSFTKANPGTVNEVWEILKLFSTKQRFIVYTEWFGGQISRLQDMQDCFNLARFETRSAMKRMSTENTKLMARQLAKVACASPGVVFEVVLNQIQAYPNLTDTVVECGRYFTYMGYDVLTWSVMRALGNPNRERLTETGFEASAWLQHLAEFCGKIFKRYSMMSPLPILQYVLDQLRKNNFIDLKVFKDLLWYMAGIVAGVDFNEAQVEAMAGGEFLRSLTLKKVLDNRHMLQGSSKRLLKVLADFELLGPFLVAIGQQRQLSIFKSEQSSLKIVSENFDSLNNIFHQYLDFVTTNLSVKDANVIIPGIPELMGEYGIPAELAFAIHRRSLAKAIADYDAEHGLSQSETKPASIEKPKANGDIEMLDAGSPESTDGAVPEAIDNASEEMKSLTDETKAGEDASKESNSSAKPMLSPTVTEADSPFHPVLRDLMERIQAALPKNFSSSLSISFYVRFWQLSLYDLIPTTKSYSDESALHEKRKRTVMGDRSDLSASGIKKRDAEQKSIEDTIARITAEMKNHVRDLTLVSRQLKQENKHWFTGFTGKFQALNAALLQNCFIPRLLLSPLDSYFTCMMIFKMHNTATPGFITMHVIDKLMSVNTLTNVMFSCSSREADNLGRFLYELLKRLGSWHADQATYEKEAFGIKRTLQGFAQNVSNGKPVRFLEYEDFRRLVYKWHRNLFDSFKSCLSNTEYMHINNGISVLRRVSRVFPAVNWMGTHLSNQINEIIAREKPEKDKPNKIVRADLWVAANSVIAGLKQREKAWVLPQAFHLNDASGKNQRSSGRSTSSVPKSPQPDRSTPKPLNATAPSFAPKSGATINGNHKASNAAVGDVEDGEVADSEVSGGKANEMPKENGRETGVKEQTETPKAEDSANSVQHTTGMNDEGTTPAANESQPAVQTTADTLKADERASPAVRASPAPPDSRPKSEGVRNTSAPSTPGRTPHSLPSRPDGPPLPPPRARNEANQQPARPDSRNRPLQDQGKPERPADISQSRPGDRPQSSTPRPESTYPAERAGQYSDRQRDNSRYYDRSMPDDRGVRGPPRDSRYPPGDRYGRQEYYDDQSSRPVSRGPQDPSRSGYPPPTNAPPQERSDAYSQSRPHGATRPPPYERSSSGYGPDSRGDRSRPQTPPRSDSRAAYGPSHAEDRPYQSNARPAPYDNRNTSTDYPPSGPRAGNRAADSMQPPPVRAPATERSFSGRSNQDSARGPPRHQDINYGRLNADQPSAQDKGGRDERNVQAGGDQPSDRAINAQSNQAPAGPAAQDRTQPPGPVADRRTRNSGSGESTATPTPAAPQTTTEATGIHPSRLAQMDINERPTPLQTNVAPPQGPSATSATSTSFANTPSGPRSAQPRNQDTGASAPSPTTRNPPTGPANNSDRGRDRRRFANLQDTINQNSPTTPTAGSDRNGDRGASIRGRATANRQAQNTVDNSTEDGRRNSQSQPQSQPVTLPANQNPPQGEDRSEQRDRRAGNRSGRDDHTHGGDGNKSSHRSSREQSRERDLREREADYTSRRGPPRVAGVPEDAAGRSTRTSERRAGRPLEGDLMQGVGTGEGGGYGPPRHDRDRERERLRSDGEHDHHGRSHGYPPAHDAGYNRSHSGRERDDRNVENYSSRRGGPPMPPQPRHDRELMPPTSQGPPPQQAPAAGGHQDWNGDGGGARRGGSMRGRKRDWPADGDGGYGGRADNGKRPRRSGP